MKTGAEILKTFRQKDELAIIGLAEWDYAELIELKKRYWVDYRLPPQNTYITEFI